MGKIAALDPPPEAKVVHWSLSTVRRAVGRTGTSGRAARFARALPTSLSRRLKALNDER